MGQCRAGCSVETIFIAERRTTIPRGTSVQCDVARIKQNASHFISRQACGASKLAKVIPSIAPTSFFLPGSVEPQIEVLPRPFRGGAVVPGGSKKLSQLGLISDLQSLFSFGMFSLSQAAKHQRQMSWRQASTERPVSLHAKFAASSHQSSRLPVCRDRQHRLRRCTRTPIRPIARVASHSGQELKI